MHVTMTNGAAAAVLSDPDESGISGERRTNHPGHPCFDRASVERVGRMHLPVAPRCNIKCRYCERRYGCVDGDGPGSADRILSPDMALLRAREILGRDGSIRAIGIAGPGDPLANEETMTTLRLINREFPHYIKCLCTNGLALPEKVAELKEAGLNNLTVTVNAVDPRIGAKIYAHVIREKRIYRGEEAAALLWSRQKEGIERSVDCGLRVKVNTILIPGINDEGVADVALAVSRLGVPLMNLVPLIPRADFSHIRPPGGHTLRIIRERLQEFLPQMGWCRQCKADATGLLHDTARCRTGCRSTLSP